MLGLLTTIDIIAIVATSITKNKIVTLLAIIFEIISIIIAIKDIDRI